MVKMKRRTKASRYRGTHTHGRGFKKKARGSGHQGGVGMAGSGKRGDQKKTLILNLFGNEYFGKDKALRRGTPRKRLKVINLGAISEGISILEREGKAKDEKGIYKLDLKGYKILGDGDLKIKVHITATSASKSAIEKIKSAGSLIDLEDFAEEDNKK